MLIIATSETEIKSFIKGYHTYKHPWKLVLNEQLNDAVELVTWLINTEFVYRRT